MLYKRVDWTRGVCSHKATSLSERCNQRACATMMSHCMLLVLLLAEFSAGSPRVFWPPISHVNTISRRDGPAPCSAGYGIREATDDFVDLDDNEGCNFLKGEVPFIDGKCVKLLEQGPCEASEWLIIDDDSGYLKCDKKECPDGQVKYDDECRFLDDTSHCKDTLELIINEHGEGECECPPGYLFHPPTEKCFIPYTRGPCRRHEIIKMRVDDKGGYAVCMPNPCPDEKMTPLDAHCLPQDNLLFAKCYTIGRQTPCNPGSWLLIEPSLAKPFCLAQRPNSIVPRIVKRAAPCQMSYTNSCMRECDGPDSYPFNGRCRNNYVYFYNWGRPICLKGRCRRVSL